MSQETSRVEGNRQLVRTVCEGLMHVRDLVHMSGYTPLMTAIGSDMVHVAKLLLEMGHDVNEAGPRGLTPLMVAASRGSVVGVQLLLKYKCDVRQRDKDGQTALMKAVGKPGCSMVVSELIATGMNVNLKDHKRRTALMFAAAGFWYCDSASQLIKAGANVNLRDRDGTTALGYAAVRVRYVDLVKDRKLNDVENVMDLLIGAGAKLDWVNKNGRNAMILAAMFGRFMNVETLLKAGANFDIQDDFGRNALMYCCVFEDEGDIFEIDFEPNYYLTAELLLDYRISKNAQDKNGMSAMMFAARFNIIQMLHIIVASGHDGDLVDKSGMTALSYALSTPPLEPIKYTANTCFRLAVKIGDGGAKQKLPPEQVHLLEKCMANVANFEPDFAALNHALGIRLCVLNGVVAGFRGDCSYFYWCTFDNISDVDLCRYLISNCYVTQHDLTMVRLYDYDLDEEKIEFLESILFNPWPLVKLAQVAVSSLIGPSEGRAERVAKLKLPTVLSNALLFKTPVATLPLHHWPDLDVMSFCPEDYEKLPSPRPYLQYWPLGHKIVRCKCKHCGKSGSKILLQ